MRAKKSERTVMSLLNADNRNWLERHRTHGLPRHTYVLCRGRNIAARFLADAEAEGFTFSDGAEPTAKDYSDIYAVNEDLTISFTGWAAHALFKNGGGNVVRIDYGKYLSGADDYCIAAGNDKLRKR